MYEKKHILQYWNERKLVADILQHSSTAFESGYHLLLMNLFSLDDLLVEPEKISQTLTHGAS